VTMKPPPELHQLSLGSSPGGRGGRGGGSSNTQQGIGGPSIYHAVEVVFLEFFFWGSKGVLSDAWGRKPSYSFLHLCPNSIVDNKSMVVL
uniref:Uncharacterized protein n=1 Tax=Anas platyrhynchos platyrhynchos TaxID=8840 RepID=A0A493TVL8_ANAPP